MLRYKADIKTLVFMAVATAMLPIQWVIGGINPILYFITLHMSVSVAVMAHNHNHVRMWKSKPLNVLTDYWITLFYGFPAFAWIPTHNLNHHNFNNRDGDYTITYRASEQNNLLTLLSYPTISGLYQQAPTNAYLKKLWRKNRQRFWFSFSQYIVVAIYLAIFFIIDWKKALFFVFIPQQVSLMAVLIFNYVQHIHANEESEWNHSRNFVGWALNAFLFNNGYHTIHHFKPGLHWSVVPREHAKIDHLIVPELKERSFWWYILRVYILGIFSARFRTRNMRLERIRAAAAIDGAQPVSRAEPVAQQAAGA